MKPSAVLSLKPSVASSTKPLAVLSLKPRVESPTGLSLEPPAQPLTNPSTQPPVKPEAEQAVWNADDLRVLRRDPAHPHAQALLGELNAALAALTGCDGSASFCSQDVRGEGGVFLVAYWMNDPVACGGYRPLETGVAEIKRVYARRRGAGLPLLRALESCAAQAGYTRLVCETRRDNTRAVAFYFRAGWRETEPYGRYIGRPEAVCLTKTVSV